MFWLKWTPLGVASDGIQAVYVFFVISGVALSYPVLRAANPDRMLAAMALYRYPRLTVPILVSCLGAWLLLFGVIVFFAVARRSARIREWIETGRAGPVLATFLAAKPLDYLIVLAIKAPSFLGSVVAQFFALALYGITIPFFKLMLFLPLVFLAAALPIAVAHLGTSQAAWLLFFSGNATAARILAYSLAAHFTFMFCNGLIGLCFLPRATRELTAIEEPA